jgi:ribosomal protein S18 acetylase RimI-like enzyme
MKRQQHLDFFRKLMKNSSIRFFLHGREAAVAVNTQFPGYRHLELFWLAVDSDYQNKGIGTELVRYVERFALDHDYRSVYLYTHPIHKKAISFYKRLGYNKINQFPDYYSNGDASLLFGKRIR